MEYFKGDTNELSVYGVGKDLMDALSLQKDLFYAGAYEAAPLGEVIYDTGRSPLSNAIVRTIFRLAFEQIFTAFVEAGTFESYLTVFRKIFGEDVAVVFTVPAPGKLEIDITADDPEISNGVARIISGNAYQFDEFITQDGVDEIVFQTIKGFESQYELEQMLFELVPGGVYTVISLTIGGA